VGGTGCSGPYGEGASASSSRPFITDSRRAFDWGGGKNLQLSKITCVSELA